MKTQELHQMSQADLKKELLATTRELFNLRIRKGVGQLTKTHTLTVARRNIARLKTIINQKQREQTGEAQS